MNISISCYTEKGKRQNNEDAFKVMEMSSSVLAVVADGLGGHENGEFAANEAVKTICKLLSNKVVDEDSLEDAVEKANEAVRNLHSKAPNALTTIAVLWIDQRYAIATNVGDTRIYQFRNGKVHYQSADHSVAYLAVLAQDISLSEIRSHRDRNKLIRVLGSESAPRADQQAIDIFPGDAFLLCTDGFWEAIGEEEMLRARSKYKEANGWLNDMRHTIANSIKDNNTAIAIIIS